MSNTKHTPMVITANEPEGWERAFEVTAGGKHIAWFRFRDSAEHFAAKSTT